ncbi:lian-aa1 retrotransposon protein, partial [Lasius niger]
MPPDSMPKLMVGSIGFSCLFPSRTEIQAFIDNLPSGGYECYTDGSKMLSAGSGVAYRIIGSNDAFSCIQVHLGDLATVFQAEVLAILRLAQELIWSGVTGQEIFIFSDSQAAIFAIASLEKRSHSVQQCTEFLNSLSTLNSVQLVWIPGHSGYAGNECADKVAKEASLASTFGPGPFCPIAYCVLRGQVKRWIFSAHKLYWANRSDCRQSLLCFGSQVFDKLLLGLDRNSLRQVTQILTGHANLARHMNLCGYAETPICPGCGHGEETTEHFV